MHLPTGVRFGRIAGVEIVADWSLLIIFWLITFSLAAGVFPAWHPEWTATLAWGTALAAAALFLASVLIHELSHALVGRLHGIVVRRITLFMFGGMAQMENEPPTWRAEFYMAIVGPLTSLALGVLFLWLAPFAGGPMDIDPDDPGAALAALAPAQTLLVWLGPVNILLALFNLVPGFPLDGGRVLRALLWAVTGSLRRATRYASRAGQGFALLLMASGVAMMLGLRVPVFGTGLVGGLWLAFIGWFLNNAAVLSYRQLLVRESLADVPVERLMQTRFARVAPALRVSTLVDEHLLPSGQRSFPVEDDSRLLGIVSLSDVRKHGRDTWDRITVGEIMTPAASVVTVGAQQDAFEALALLAGHNLNQLPVVEDGRVVGLLRREDIVTWLALHGERAPESGR